MVSNSLLVRSASPILFVDLDGTLLKTDLLWEAVRLAVTRSPWTAWRIPLWAAQGRAVLKSRLAERFSPEPQDLPYRTEVLAFLHEQKAQGRTLVLATASDEKWARAVADQVGIFDDVLASDGQRNLKGPVKLHAIQAYCRAHGSESFGYVGDSRADVPIWRAAAEAYVCAPSARLLRAVEKSGESVHVLGKAASRLLAVVRILRPQQWVKNLLLFIPLVVGHAWGAPDKILAGLLAFVAFCAVASAAYVVNDLLDVEADRSHPIKRRRPFASGDVPLPWGPPLALGLVVCGFALALASLPGSFVALLALYLVLTNIYSFWLKRKAIMDVLVLAGLYTLRILAGGAATDVVLSEWLMAFSMFLFTSLAFAKRFAELARLTREKGLDPKGRGYVVEDLTILESIGTTTGCLAVLVFALYINSPIVKELYVNHLALWAICPMLLYGITRLWLLAKRGKLTEDPVLFLCKDRTSLLVGLVVALLFVIATLVPMAF